MENINDNIENKENEQVSPKAINEQFRRPYLGDAALSADQIRELRKKYNVRQMTVEQEETLFQDLKQMGIPGIEACSTYQSPSGNILEELTRQFSADINRLYRMAIAGKDSVLHYEHLQRQQKLINVLEQIAEA